MPSPLVLFDLDGVLADFEGHLRSQRPGLPEDLFSMEDREFWAIVKSIPNFWEDLPLVPGAKDLFEFSCQNFETGILSAPSRHDDRSCIGKNVWLNRHFGHLFFERNFVRAERKELFAAEGIVLVDDQLKNILAWNAKGGMGIHFVSSEETIDILEKIKKN